MSPSELLRYSVEAIETLGIRYYVTGSVASSYFGEPRFTNDIDLVVDVRSQHVARLCASFPSPEFYLSEDAVRQALLHRTQFNVIHPTSGLKVDLMVPPDTPFNRARFDRAVRGQPTPECEAWFSSAEDVILKKMEFYREGGSEKHLRDITGILKVSGDRLDMNYLAEWVSRLGVTPIWEAVRQRVEE